MATATTAYGANGSVIKGFHDCERMVVRYEDLHRIIERARADLGRSSENEDLSQFVARMGFASWDSYYRFMTEMKSDWVSIDTADRMLVGLGLHYLFNTDAIAIYQIREGLAYVLAW